MSRVQIAYLHTEEVSHSFHHSLMSLFANNHQRLMPDTCSAFCSTLALVEGRNELMAYFLDNTDATHIFWIDTDMGFHPDIVDKLLDTNLPVVGALTYGSKKTPDTMGGYKTEPYVVAYDLNRRSDGLVHYTPSSDLNIDGTVQQVAATGAAALLIDRDSVKRVAEVSNYGWFDQVAYLQLNPPMRLSEDLSFCYRLTTLGIPIYIHTGVRTSHMKTEWIS